MCFFYRDSLGWAILFNFLVYVSLPIPLKYTGVLFGVGSYTLHLCTTLVLPKIDEFFFQQVQLNCPFQKCVEFILLRFFIATCKRVTDDNSSYDWFAVLLYGRVETQKSVFGSQTKS